MSQFIIIDKKKYRQKVIVLLYNENKEFLLVQNKGYSDNEWNFPGGGIEENEIPKDTVIREINEELGVIYTNILKKSKHIYKYIIPKKRWKIKPIPYDGQYQHVFIGYLEKNTNITIPTDELKKYKWVSKDELKNHLIFPMQYSMAQEIISEFNL